MAAKTLFLYSAMLASLQSAIAIPLSTYELPRFDLKRDNITKDPSQDIQPIITQIEEMTWDELQDFIKEIEDSIVKREPDVEALAPSFTKKTDASLAERGSKTHALAARETGTDGALLTWIDGDSGPNIQSCPDFSINGPFTSIHAIMGSSTPRGIEATSYGGNSTSVIAGDTVVDAGVFTFADNERVTGFQVAQYSGTSAVSGFRFDTDAGNSYEALGTVITDTNVPTWTNISVGSGIMARIRGTNCANSSGLLGMFGIDFLDELDSISITNMDYSGFTSNIMPAGDGTQMSVGSQVLDNRNSSVEQTITLLTTDAVTQSHTVTTDIHATVGGSVTVEAEVGVPLISSGKTTAEANWEIGASNVSFYSCDVNL